MRSKTIQAIKTFCFYILFTAFFVSSTGLSVFAQIEATPGGTTIQTGSSLPNITSMFPTTAVAGASITISGTGFSPNQTMVKIDGQTGATITSSSATSITFTLPSVLSVGCNSSGTNCTSTTPLISGIYSVFVTTPNGESNSKILIVPTTVPTTPTNTSTTSAIQIISPNTNETFRVGRTYASAYTSSNVPTGAAIVMGLVGQNTANTQTLGTVFPIPATTTLYFAIPTQVRNGATSTMFVPGSYKLSLSLYNKPPCTTTTGCTPATLLASDTSDSFFTVISATSTELALGEQGAGGDGGGLGGLGSLVATCAITSFAGNAAKSALSGIVGKASSWLKTNITNKITSTLSNAVGISGPQKVPVVDSVTNTNTQQTNQNAAKLVKKETGGAVESSSGSILSGIANDLFSEPSLDALAFCIANELIHYITQSTIQWINSGFQGKPVFVENADAFFRDAADREAGNFIREIVGSATDNSIDVCQPFKVQLAVDSIQSYTRKYNGVGGRGQCTLSSIKNNYEGFMNSWSQGGLPGWFELIQKPNNIYGARYLAQEELQRRVGQKQNTLTLELNWAKGYKSFKKCTVAKRPDGSCPEGKEVTMTPGQVIENSINERMGSAQRRLEIADEFDELVSALVNALVKVAVNEVFSIGSNSGGSGGSSQSSNPRDTTLPNVSVVTPVANTAVSGTIQLTANADDDADIAYVQFKIDGNNVGEQDKTAPYTANFNTQTLQNGIHKITATARDTSGNEKTSTEISFTVTNTTLVPAQ